MGVSKSKINLHKCFPCLRQCRFYPMNVPYVTFQIAWPCPYIDHGNCFFVSLFLKIEKMYFSFQTCYRTETNFFFFFFKFWLYSPVWSTIWNEDGFYVRGPQLFVCPHPTDCNLWADPKHIYFYLFILFIYLFVKFIYFIFILFYYYFLFIYLFIIFFKLHYFEIFGLKTFQKVYLQNSKDIYGDFSLASVFFGPLFLRRVRAITHLHSPQLLHSWVIYHSPT